MNKQMLSINLIEKVYMFFVFFSKFELAIIYYHLSHMQEQLIEKYQRRENEMVYLIIE